MKLLIAARDRLTLVPRPAAGVGLSKPASRTLAALALLLGVGDAAAAPITWGSATAISGDGDVSTNGTLVNAVNLGASGVAATTVNGVLFDPVVMTGSSVSSGDFTFAIQRGFSASNGAGSGSAPFSALSAPYQSLLSSIGGDFTTPFTLTMSGLTPGHTYEVEAWSNNSNGFENQQLTLTSGNVLVLNSNPSNPDGGVGQFGVGSFTADATSEVITFSAGGQSFLNGVQLRDTTAAPEAIPEPATLAVFGALAAGAFGVRRRRKATA